MGDNAAAERVVRKLEREKQRVAAIEQVAKDGLKALLSDIKNRAELAREIKSARSNTDSSQYQEWLRKFNERYEDGSDYSGYDTDNYSDTE